MVGTFLSIFVFVTLICGAPSHGKSAFVKVHGFVPPGISAAFISREYRQIYEKLAPDIPPSRAPLYVIYFSRKMVPTTAYWLPEWGGGGAIGTDTIIVAVDAEPLFENDIRVTTVHELVHIVIKRLTSQTPIPRWFHEGTALLLSGDLTHREQVVLSQANLTGAFLPLDTIEQVNGFGPFQARLAYAQSRQAVGVLVDTYGMGVLSELLDAADSTGSFSSAIYAVLGLTDRELEQMILTQTRKRFNPFMWIADSYSIWIGIVVLFLIGFVITRIRNRKKALQMEREEKLQQLEQGGEDFRAED